ncbi:hypothetical protein ACJIZ3_017818 [Penstemon smallii]|uniref:Uncharacterized protein n=1 Tax=Penstemon smallii TaxID=265156 RepID=A0ABD3SXF8_9LAMI
MDLLLFQKILLSLIFAIVVVSKLRGKRFTNLPPGPFPYPIFGSWIEIGNNLDQLILSNYAKKFGNLFRVKMGQLNIIVISSKELAKEVFLTRGVEFGSRSRNIVYDIFTGEGQDMIFTEYGEHWRKMKRIATVPFFTKKSVQQYHGAWEAEAAAVVEDVKKNKEAATNGIVLRMRLQLMVYNNLYKSMFDKRFESEEDPLYVRVKDLNGQRSKLGLSLEYNFGDFVPILRPFIKGYLKICKEVTATRLNLFKDHFIDERKKLISTGGREINKCGIDYLFEAQEKGEINDAHVCYIVENMNIAAIGTTVWALEWAIAELINNPHIQNKLRAEIKSVLGPTAQVTEPDNQKLPYLQAVIKETLRFRTIVPLLLPHMNPENTKLGGYDIPARSRILVNAWHIFNDPANWKKPEEFRPERFLEEESNVEVNGNDVKYFPFGMGRRSCPGMLSSMAVLGITLGRLVQNFEMLPPPGQDKIDMTAVNVQFGMYLFKHSTVVLKPIIMS